MNHPITQRVGVSVLFLFCLLSCNNNDQTKEVDQAVQLLPDAPAQVTTVTLKTVDFEHELVSNGNIKARTIAELKFHSSETIRQILVKNGASVSKGERIAVLDTFSINNRLNQAKDALDRSRLEMQDVLIGQGYKLDSLDSVPPAVMQLARVKSGFNAAQTQLKTTEYDLRQATLRAPVSGMVANLFAKPHTSASPSEVFCHIIDTRSLEVEFSVLENELGFIRIGDNMKIVPFSMPDVEVNGRISEINPWVDENGMVRVKASVNHHPRLVVGMNVRVSTFRNTGKQWVVPKTAVVMRTGKQVVFSEVDGKAQWNYVQTGLENASQYTITSETLHEGDKIIVSGNINLAHESPVTVVDAE